MKEIILYRHAEAEPAVGGRPDEERRLTVEGKAAAEHLGLQLRERDLAPQRVLCSQARRAVESAELSAEASETPAAIERLPALYAGGAEDYIATFADQPAELSRVMIVGHNPVIEEVIESLTGSYQRIRAGDAAVLQFDVADWLQIAAERTARLAGVFPDGPARPDAQR